jgi:hypothetical protein
MFGAGTFFEAPFFFERGKGLRSAREKLWDQLLSSDMRDTAGPPFPSMRPVRAKARAWFGAGEFFEASKFLKGAGVEAGDGKGDKKEASGC